MRPRLLVLIPALAAALLANAGKKFPDLNVQHQQSFRPAGLDKLAAFGGMVKPRFSALPGAVDTVPAGILDRLAARPEVTCISPDRPDPLSAWTLSPSGRPGSPDSSVFPPSSGWSASVAWGDFAPKPLPRPAATPS